MSLQDSGDERESESKWAKLVAWSNLGLPSVKTVNLQLATSHVFPPGPGSLKKVAGFGFGRFGTPGLFLGNPSW